MHTPPLSDASRSEISSYVLSVFLVLSLPEPALNREIEKVVSENRQQALVKLPRRSPLSKPPSPRVYVRQRPDFSGSRNKNFMKSTSAAVGVGNEKARHVSRQPVSIDTAYERRYHTMGTGKGRGIRNLT